MAITAEQRGDILELLVLMFDAAPGATFLSDITSLYDAIPGTHAQKMQGLASTLSNTGVFQSLHPNFQTANEFATDFLSTIGLENNADARLFITANFGNGSPATKAALMYFGWNFLNSYTGTDPDFLKAQAIMLNKAEVSEYYSVTLGESAFDVDTLQDVLVDVNETQESVDAALEELEDAAAELQVLTPGNDIINVLLNDPITIEGIVDGDSDGSGNDDRSSSTFNPGDNITGNGSTELNLVIVDGGDAGFMRLTEIEQVNIEAGTNDWIYFNAAGWTGVGEVTLNDGVDGLYVSLDNLEAGTVISVADVTGSIGASYDTDGGNAWLWIRNDDEGGEGITGVATAEGNITVEGADSVSVTIWNNTGVSLGDVNVTVGDSSYFSLEFASDEDFSVGDINVVAGDESDANIYVTEYVSGDVTFGDINLTLGDSSSVDLEFTSMDDGSLTVGNVDVEMGASADFTLSVSSNDNVAVTFGDVSVVAGDNAELDVWVYNNDAWSDEDGSVTFGDIALSGGIASSINVTFDGYGEDGPMGQMLTVGNVTLTAGDAETGEDGDDSYVNLRVVDFSSADFGDVSLVAGTGGTVDVSFSYITGDLDIGNVHLEGPDHAEMTVLEVTGDVTIGNVEIMSSGSAWAWIAKSGYGDGTSEAGSVTVGDVTIHAGASGYASFDVQDYNQVTVGNVEVVAGTSANVEVEAEGNLGNITVGNVMVSATGESGWAGISLTNDYNPNAGNITAGNLTAIANGDNGSVEIEVYNSATDFTTAENTGTAVGNITIGDVTASVGSETDVGEDMDGQDGTDVYVDIYNVAWSNYGEDGTGSQAGDVTVGDINVTLGDGFVSGTLTNDSVAYIRVANWGEEGMGDLTVGDIQVTGGDFLDADISLSGYANYTAEVGDMTVGNIGVDGGESANVNVNAYWGITAAGSVGDMTLGDVTINVAQDSVVVVNVDHSITDTDSEYTNELGDLEVGNVDIVAGDNAEVYVYINSYADFGSMEDAVDGSFTVGDISVAVSATETEDLSGSSNVTIAITRESWNNDAGEGTGGDFTVGDITVSAAGDEASIDIDVYNSGSWDEMGNTTIGMIDVSAANSATINVYASAANYTTGDIGDVTFGGIGIHMGDDGTAAVTFDVSDDDYAGDWGNIDFGDWTVEVGDGASVVISASITQDNTGDGIGDFRVGDVTVVAGDTSTITMTYADAYMYNGDIGNVTIGNFDATLGEGSTLYYSPDVSATDAGEVGDVSVGDITANIGADSYLSYSAQVVGNSGVGDITIGSIDVSAGEGAEIDYLIVSVTADDGSLGSVLVGDVSIDLDVSATMYDSGYLYFWAQNDIDGVTVGDVSIEGSDGAVIEFSITASVSEGQAGDMLVGDITLTGLDEGVTVTTDAGTEEAPDISTYDIGAEIILNVNNWGSESDDLTVGDVTITVEGANTDTSQLQPADSVQLFLGSNGDITIGDVTVSGAGLFILDGQDHSATPGASFIAVDAGGDITIGDIDFSGYENDITLDLSWTDAGADNITAGEGDDVVYDNEGDNVIAGGEGADYLDITEGGADTIVTSEGESGLTEDAIDTIEGFEAVDGDDEINDLLDFNYVAGTAGNYVEDANGVSDFDTFLDDAAANLNSTVRYYAAYDSGAGLTYVAVNYGSGEADMVVALVGDHIDTLTYANFIA